MKTIFSYNNISFYDMHVYIYLCLLNFCSIIIVIIAINICLLNNFCKLNKSKTAIVKFYLIPIIENKIFVKQVSTNESVECNIIFCQYYKSLFDI